MTCIELYFVGSLIYFYIYKLALYLHVACEEKFFLSKIVCPSELSLCTNPFGGFKACSRFQEMFSRAQNCSVFLPLALVVVALQPGRVTRTELMKVYRAAAAAGEFRKRSRAHLSGPKEGRRRYR